MMKQNNNVKKYVCYGCGPGEYCYCIVRGYKKPKDCVLDAEYLEAEWQECCPHCGQVIEK